MKHDEIKTLRNALNLTQEQFARKIGVTTVTVNRWEMQGVKPSRLAINRMNTLNKRLKTC